MTTTTNYTLTITFDDGTSFTYHFDTLAAARTYFRQAATKWFVIGLKLEPAE